MFQSQLENVAGVPLSIESILQCLKADNLQPGLNFVLLNNDRRVCRVILALNAE